MRKVVIRRKRKFASALLPYWIITGLTKKEFMYKFGLEGDRCKSNAMGQAISRIDISVLDSVGVRISNGQTVEIELSDDVTTLFASTMDGCLSNEIKLDDFFANKKNHTLSVSTKGGFKTLSYPYFEQEG